MREFRRYLNVLSTAHKRTNENLIETMETLEYFESEVEKYKKNIDELMIKVNGVNRVEFILNYTTKLNDYVREFEKATEICKSSDMNEMTYATIAISMTSMSSAIENITSILKELKSLDCIELEDDKNYEPRLNINCNICIVSIKALRKSVSTFYDGILFGEFIK